MNLPEGLQLSAEVPANFASYEDCVNGPLGFVLSGPALEERPLVGNIEHYDLKPDGIWLHAGSGQRSSGFPCLLSGFRLRVR